MRGASVEVSGSDEQGSGSDELLCIAAARSGLDGVAREACGGNGSVCGGCAAHN